MKNLLVAFVLVTTFATQAYAQAGPDYRCDKRVADKMNMTYWELQEAMYPSLYGSSDQPIDFIDFGDLSADAVVQEQTLRSMIVDVSIETEDCTCETTVTVEYQGHDVILHDCSSDQRSYTVFATGDNSQGVLKVRAFDYSFEDNVTTYVAQASVDIEVNEDEITAHKFDADNWWVDHPKNQDYLTKKKSEERTYIHR